MELKLINRNELNAILKSLFRRIINHEKVCKNVEKLSLEEVQGLSKKKSLKSRESITSEKDREI